MLLFGNKLLGLKWFEWLDRYAQMTGQNFSDL